MTSGWGQFAWKPVCSVMHFTPVSSILSISSGYSVQHLHSICIRYGVQHEHVHLKIQNMVDCQFRNSLHSELVQVSILCWYLLTIQRSHIPYSTRSYCRIRINKFVYVFYPTCVLNKWRSYMYILVFNNPYSWTCALNKIRKLCIYQSVFPTQWSSRASAKNSSLPELD